MQHGDTRASAARRTGSAAGFTFLELVVVLSILAILAGTLIPRVATRMAAARDARRVQDIQRVRDAVERFQRETGRYPAPHRNAAHGGWDVSQDGDLIPELVDRGYLAEAPRDPIDDETHHYRYYLYEPGAYRCAGAGAFYVLGVKNFETEAFRAEHKGSFRCGERDWSDEFAHVTGGGTDAR